MTKMAKKILARILWLGRGTATTMGVAVMLALTLGLASTALAALPGDPFKLGRTNTVDKMSQLVGSASGAMLRVVNNGSGPALDLRVESGEAPMNVNSAARVDGFNADQLDGKDSTAFVPTETYEVQDSGFGQGGGQIGNRRANCDRGDMVLNWGFNISSGDTVITADPSVSDDTGLFLGFEDNGFASEIVARVTCADFPPLRP